jgi:hypothetical protein
MKSNYLLFLIVVLEIYRAIALMAINNKYFIYPYRLYMLIKVFKLNKY